METASRIETLDSIGVDYLTATRYRTSGARPFQELGEHLLMQSASYGNDVHNWQRNGYHGNQSGGVVAGVRYDTHIIKLSSDEAREHWREVHALATNVTRIDLQITFKLKQQDKRFIEQQHARALVAKTGRGRKPEIEIRANTRKGATLYLGSRTSNVYGRCYDSGKKEKLYEAGVLIRQELEIKSETAKSVAQSLASTDSETASILSTVSSYMKRFEIETAAGNAAINLSARGRTTDENVCLAWLHRAAAPSITRLVHRGRLSEVIQMLGLSDYVTIRENGKEED